MAEAKVTPARDAEQIRRLLDLPEVGQLIAQLDALRWTGRAGYGARAMVGMAMVKSLYCIPVWTRVVALVRDHAALRDVIGAAPSEWACYRFAAKLRTHADALAACLDAVVSRLSVEVPGYGEKLAIDGSDLPAYANGQRYLFKDGPEREHFADPDATWGHRSSVGTRSGGGFYGFKVHAAVCANTDLPVAWVTRTAKACELPEVETLLDIAKGRGIVPAVAVLDKNYDAKGIYAECVSRKIRPVIALIETATVKRGEHKPPTCDHGQWTFAGADDKRQATQWRCPTRECAPKSIWRPYSRLHPPIPHGSARHKALYRKRVAVERGFGRLKNEWGALPLRVRGIDRVTLHVDLTMLACLGTALDRANRVAVAA
ncbi:MAG TPA: transposase [Frankiaceae bacterium]|nr:transposase [Frankiaceae bacterium]